MMYLIVILLMPVLYLFNPPLAMVGLIAAIVWMCVQRTRTQKRPRPRSADDQYEPGYK